MRNKNIPAGLLTRRQWLWSAAVGASWPIFAAQFAPLSFPGAQRTLCLNEDCSHFFTTRARNDLTAGLVAAFVDQYANTQVGTLLFNPNCMRTSYASEVWDPIWKGYDPFGPDDQPLLKSTPSPGRELARAWIHTAWELDQKEIDVYSWWINRCRLWGISPWISMRMNDVHNLSDPSSYIHSDFWRQNPRLRLPTSGGLDYGQSEVREYNMLLVRELAARYDFDGLELDWMRSPAYFQPGCEAAGSLFLSEFVGEVRSLLNHWQSARRHPIRLGVRVPSRPETAQGLGLDAVTWVTTGLVDQLVVTPRWATVEFDMPIAAWRRLLEGADVTLVAGLELLLRPFPDSPFIQTNTLKTVRGAAASLLDLGADAIYLFNYMDSQTCISDSQNYRALLREVGSLDTLAAKARRHILTYTDSWAPSETPTYSLPVACQQGAWAEFRLPTGPRPVAGSVTVRLDVTGASEAQVSNWQVRVNDDACSFLGRANVGPPCPPRPMFEFSVPACSVIRGYNRIAVLPNDLSPGQRANIEWVEFELFGSESY